MDNPFKNPRVITYCPGVLGLDRGVKRALGTVRAVAYVEIEAFICENLLAGMEAGILDAAPIWCNLKTFDARPFRGKIHGIIGGYPCQPFSSAGKRKGENDSRHLYPYLERDIKATGPVWCFFENVSGHLSLGFDQVYRSLSKMGYAVEAGIFTAEEVGAPHERERLFILAVAHIYRNQWGIPKREQGQGWSEQGDSVDLERCREEILSYSDEQGLQITTRRKFKQFQKETRTQARGEYGGIFTEDRWPARPGEPQYDWEEPRTVKSGMGSTINGYNFREDLLRAYGNSVVEQTAELAFNTLLAKHGICINQGTERTRE